MTKSELVSLHMLQHIVRWLYWSENPQESQVRLHTSASVGKNDNLVDSRSKPWAVAPPPDPAIKQFKLEVALPFTIEKNNSDQ